jgi:hypothetical protein
MTMKVLFAVAALLLSSQVLAEPPATGPFGFTQGMSLAQLKKLGPVEPGPKPVFFRMHTAPKNHSGFYEYYLFVSPSLGLCKVVASGKVIATDGYGQDVRKAFENLEVTLTERYGSSSKLDELRTGSLWKNPNEWMMALLKKERTLAVVWDAESGARLPKDVQTIALQADAITTESGNVKLSVEYNNLDACQKQFRDKENDAL